MLRAIINKTGQVRVRLAHRGFRTNLYGGRRALGRPQSASMLALLLLLHHATARELNSTRMKSRVNSSVKSKLSGLDPFKSDTPQETPQIKKISSCPDVGYYFSRESNPNTIEPVCHLCFCHGDGTAMCWRRELSRCDTKHYQHYGRDKRYNEELCSFSRVRRSPGFSDIFFSDAAKAVFNKNSPEECKPYEASYSEGCPPVDWCIGCTVCDCNANGRWDCHVLSFCDDKKGKKKMKKKRGKVAKRQANKTPHVTTTTKKSTPNTKRKPNKINPPKKSNKQPVKRNQGRSKKMSGKPTSKPNKGKAQKVMPGKKRNTPSVKNKSTPKSKEQPNKKIVRRSKEPPDAQIVEGDIKTLNGHEDIVKNITHVIFKKVMDSVDKIIRDSQKNITHAVQQKIIQKRSMPTQNKPKLNFKAVKKGSKNIQGSNIKGVKGNKGRRSKREIPAMTSSKYYSQKGNLINTTDILNVTAKAFVFKTLENDIIFVTPKDKISAKPNYFKYTVDLENVTHSKNLNLSHVEQILIPNEAKNASSKAISNAVSLKIIASENKQNIRTKLQTKDYFKTYFINISNSQIINHAVNENMANNYDSNFTSKVNITCGKICKLRKIFKKFIGSGNTNTTMPTKNKNKKFNILKYLKTVFRKVFIKRKVKYNSTMKNVKRSNRKYSFIRTICQNFGSCNIDIKNQKIAYKIDQLRAESNNIMQSIRSIKGLLKLLDIDRKKTKQNSIDINGPISNYDIEKLNAIIKDNYEEYNLDNLTETQRVQVSYIKQNTKVFMQSMENFAEILNDIVQILTNRKTHYTKFSNHHYRNPKKQSLSMVDKTKTVVEKLDKIKKLLINYNLVQNKFMKRMYDVIKTLGPETNQTTNIIKVSNENKTNNNTVAIEIYTQNIIENLRKLKNLARKLSFRNRRKREAMDDTDVVEYLLILMEYLLKQQKQLKTSPAHDGIDLLIEAIKSAPDIKTTRKKVLEYIPATMEIYTTVAASKLVNANKMVDETNVTSNSAVPKFKTFEAIDDDDDSRDYYQYNKKFHKKNNLKKGKFETEDITTPSFLPISPLTTPSSYINLADDEKTNAMLDKTDIKQKYGNKRFEIFIDDTDDDDGIVLTTTKPGKSTEKESVTTKYYGPIKPSAFNNLRDEQSIYKESNDTHSSQHNRIKLDWIEDSYTQEDERKELPRLLETTTEKLSPTHTILIQEVATRTSRKKVKKLRKHDDPISSISKETEDQDSKTKHLNAEYVMYKKQMNLLHSLDYGTEKIEMEADSTEEKSNVEQFPSYFV